MPLVHCPCQSRSVARRWFFACNVQWRRTGCVRCANLARLALSAQIEGRAVVRDHAVPTEGILQSPAKRIRRAGLAVRDEYSFWRQFARLEPGAKLAVVRMRG